MLGKKGNEVLGWFGSLIGLGGVGVLFWNLSREWKTLYGFWLKPPHTALPVYYLLLVAAVILLSMLIFNTPLGKRRVIRIVVGIAGVINIFMVFYTFVLSFTGELLYYPILKMNLEDLGGPGYAAQIAKSTLALPGLLLAVVFGILIFNVLHITNFWKQYFEWQIQGLQSFAFGLNISAKDEATDVVICIDEQTKRPVVWREVDQPTNLGVFGSIGSGKTTQVLVPVLAQFLLKNRLGMWVIEPKGDLVEKLVELAKEAGRKYVYLNPEDPDTSKYNPLTGDDIDIVAEVNHNALAATFGKQDPFFAKNQGAVAKNMIYLLKYLRGNKCTYMDLIRCLLDEKITIGLVNELERRLPDSMEKMDPDDPKVMLIHWFKSEYIGNPEMRKHSQGLRIHLEEMLSNKYFRRVIIGESSFDMETLLNNGEDLFINTNDGVLGDYLSSVLGIFLIQHYQAAIRKRGPIPPSGEARRKFKLSVFCADEFAGYISEEFGSFISKARGYGAVCILAMQTITQLLEVGHGSNNRAFQSKVLGQLRSKIIFGGVEFADADHFAKSFGKQDEEVVSTTSSVSHGPFSWFIPNSANEGERKQMMEKEIYNATEIMYLPEKRVIYRVMANRSLQMPQIGMVDWFIRDKSSVGGACWFDEKEFRKKLKERKGKLSLQNGSWLQSLGLEIGKGKKGEKQVASAEEGMSVIEEGTLPVTQEAALSDRIRLAVPSDSAFRFSMDEEEKAPEKIEVKNKDGLVEDGFWPIEQIIGTLEGEEPKRVQPEAGVAQKVVPVDREVELTSRGKGETVKLESKKKEGELLGLEDLPQNADDLFNI